MTRQKRLQRRIGLALYRLDDWIVNRWESAPGWVYATDEGWGRIFCKVLGHSPTVDHCGMAEHDYCAWCSASTPYGVKRGADGRPIWD